MDAPPLIWGGMLSSSAVSALVVTALGLALVVAFGWRVLRGGSRDAEALSDGAVLLVSDGVVQQFSPEARALLGDVTGRRVPEVIEAALGADADQALNAVARLEQTGEPIDMLVRRHDDRLVELIGAPFGAMIRLVLRDARYLDEQLRQADARLAAADAALHERSWERETLHGLVAEAPIIAWHRTAEGVVSWSAGQIRTRGGSVTPEQTVDLIVARTRLNRQPALAGEPQKSRIEIVVGDTAETVSLHVVEIVRPDGTRIGFATDAGTAAAAERTLTRFVQTMTETFAHLTVGLAIFDRNQTLALFNPALVQMWQIEPSWLARRPSLRDILDELRAIRRLPELEDFHRWRARLLGLFENTEAADYEELWHLADGSNIRVLARPHPHGSLAFNFDDVTERMRLEQRYRHSIDLRRATLDGLSEGVAVFGANGLLQFVNQAFHDIWGTDADTVYAAMHARQLIALCEQITGEPELWQRLHGFITGEENRRTWTVRLRMNSGRALTARFAPLPDGSTMAVFADVTEAELIADALVERNAALEMAEHARAALGGLVSARSAPALERIEAGLGALDRIERLPEPARGAVGELAKAAAGLRGVLDGAAGIAARPLDPAEDPDPGGDVAEALSFATAIAAPRAESAGVALDADLAAAPGRVACPAGRLRQIAFSLALDAIACSASGGDVVLAAEGTPERFSLCAVAGSVRPPQAGEPSSADLVFLQRLVGRQGGRVEVEDDQAAGRRRVICRFGERRPGHGNGDPTTGAPDQPSGYGGNVRELRSSTG